MKSKFVVHNLNVYQPIPITSIDVLKSALNAPQSFIRHIDRETIELILPEDYVEVTPLKLVHKQISVTTENGMSKIILPLRHTKLLYNPALKFVLTLVTFPITIELENSEEANILEVILELSKIDEQYPECKLSLAITTLIERLANICRLNKSVL